MAENYEIKRNNLNGGLSCKFHHNGKEYFADLAFVLDRLCEECMIFEIIDGKINWGDELYVKWHIPLTEDALVECIEDFKKGESVYCVNR